MKTAIGKMNVICPNCGQETITTAECPRCHFPLVEGKITGKQNISRKNSSLAWRLFKNLITAVLVIIIAGLAFLHFSPDYGIYVVRSGSMTPAIRTGDIIITGPRNGFLQSEIEPGTVITYQHGKDLITHRVQSIDGDKIVTRGDALEEADPWQVVISDVRGIYLFKLPYIGYLPYFIRTKLGWFLLILLPAAVLVALLVKDIIKEAFKS
ncbi:MAG: signal peptidase I [Chloroflexi bacterium]|nr:signal peptidase I [Chloroflexota bacterium]